MSGFPLTYEHLKAWCERANLEVRTNDDLGQIAVAYTMLDQPAPLVIIPMVDRGLVMFMVRLPFTVPKERYAAVTSSMALLNASSYMGAWLLNESKGEAIFRLSLPASDVEYTDRSVGFVARLAVSTAERVAKGMAAVALEGADPQAALPVSGA